MDNGQVDQNNSKNGQTTENDTNTDIEPVSGNATSEESAQPSTKTEQDNSSASNTDNVDPGILDDSAVGSEDLEASEPTNSQLSEKMAQNQEDQAYLFSRYEGGSFSDAGAVFNATELDLNFTNAQAAEAATFDSSGIILGLINSSVMDSISSSMVNSTKINEGPNGYRFNADATAALQQRDMSYTTTASNIAIAAGSLFGPEGTALGAMAGAAIDVAGTVYAQGEDAMVQATSGNLVPS
jgi:hypothetical protein